MQTHESLRIAVPHTYDGNGIGEVIITELHRLGHRPAFFELDSELPTWADLVFFFGPFGKFLHVPQQLAAGPRRPLFVYWNTEGLPDLRLPSPLVGALGRLRSWAGRLEHAGDPRSQSLARLRLLAQLDRRLLRFRYVGDYLYALRQGWLDVFADISAVYAALLSRYGIPALVAPFGSFPDWYADLDLTRDVDVLWMGKRGSRRRSDVLDRLRAELRSRSVEITMVDNVEHPFVYDDERTHLLNRTKITLNLLRTWYDENSLRIAIAAPNRSLIVSEPLLAHVPQYRAGEHYAAAPLSSLADTIVYYLEHEEERRRLAENGWRLTTQEITWQRSMQLILDAALKVRCRRAGDLKPLSRQAGLPVRTPEVGG